MIRGTSERILLLRLGGKIHILKLEPFRIGRKDSNSSVVLRQWTENLSQKLQKLKLRGITVPCKCIFVIQVTSKWLTFCDKTPKICEKYVALHLNCNRPYLVQELRNAKSLMLPKKSECAVIHGLVLKSNRYTNLST